MASSDKTDEELSQVLLTLDSTLLKEHVDSFQVDDDKLPLFQLIPRIIYEKGSFLNLSEKQLEQEIANEQTGKSLDIENDDVKMTDDEEVQSSDAAGMEKTSLQDENGSLTNTEPTTRASVNEMFFKAKAEVLNNVGLAMNESGLSLDLISLLISCVRPAAGTISMSAHLKKFVPPGSLNSGKIAKKLTPEEQKVKVEEDRLIGQGWKLSTLETACTNLRNSSIRLIEEVLKEKIFWDIIMKNFDNKEIIYKTRDKQTGKRVFAVKYGYEDSGSSFKVSGNAILKPVNDKQQLEFVPINSNSRNSLIKKILRVRIFKKQDNIEDDFVITGESAINDSFPKDDSIKSQIDKARFFIFEEELFTQLIDEAGSLLPYNVKVENESKLTIEVSNNEMIEIEAIEFDEDVASSEEFDINQRTEDKRANIISSYLRLMLTIKFKKNLQAKQKPKVLKPSNNQSSSSSKSYSSILRPIIGQFRHEVQLDKIYHAIKDLLQNVPNSQFQFRKHSNLTKSELQNDPLKRISIVPVSKFVIKVNDSLKIIVLLDSFDFVNHVYHVDVFKRDEEFSNVEKLVASIKFEELHQVSECLEWIIEEYK